MNVVFLGLMYTEQSLLDAKKYSKCGLQMAPHNFQTTLINGFKQLKDVNVSVLNIPIVGSFPFNYKFPVIKKEHWDVNNVQIGYLNIPIIKRIQQKRKLIHQLREIISEYGQEDLFLMAYNTYEPFLKVLQKLKKQYPNIKNGLIVTDCVPGRGDMDKFMTRRAKRLGDRVVRYSQNIDFFVLLTKHLVTALEINDKSHVIMECICNEKQACCKVKKFSNNICLYTGSLESEFGICEMVDAFSLLDNAELWICGEGSGKDYIEKMAKKHHNIKFYGFMSPAQLQELRNESDYLINPRRPTGSYTKYSFPSKTAEYMMSGKPVIMYKLEGIPDEYDKFLNYLSAETSEEIKVELEKIFSQEYSLLTDKAVKGREFMLYHKNSKAQAENIINNWR